MRKLLLGAFLFHFCFLCKQENADWDYIVGSTPIFRSMVSLNPIEDENSSCLVSDNNEQVIQLDDSRPAG